MSALANSLLARRPAHRANVRFGDVGVRYPDSRRPAARSKHTTSLKNCLGTVVAEVSYVSDCKNAANRPAPHEPIQACHQQHVTAVQGVDGLSFLCRI
jgi:hypothetical protein